MEGEGRTLVVKIKSYVWALRNLKIGCLKHEGGGLEFSLTSGGLVLKEGVSKRGGSGNGCKTVCRREQQRRRNCFVL